jgi:hypothetical protein
MPAYGRTIRGPEQLQRFMKTLPPKVEKELERQSSRSADEIAQEARRRTGAPGVARVAKHLEPTIEASGDTVSMGGTRMLPPRNGRARSGANQTVGAILWGAEMGSTRHRQFSAWRQDGYILNPALSDEGADELANEHADAAMEAVRRA